MPRLQRTFGFQPDPFPAKPPYSFAMLRRDDAEIMLPYICGRPVTIFWSWPPRSGESPRCSEALSACSTAWWSSRLATPMATGSG